MTLTASLLLLLGSIMCILGAAALAGGIAAAYLNHRDNVHRG